jgi:hypothetical protein
VLAWLLAALGAPPMTTGLLVPVRESGSLLPQAALVPWVQRFAHRKWVWVIGALGQAVGIVVIALVAAFANGAAAGWGVLGGLAVFALSRALSSIASKDVLGRVVDKGGRGRVTGWADSASGLIAITIGLGIRFFGTQETPRGPLVGLIIAAAVVWVVAGALFATIDEPAGETTDAGASEAVGALRLLVDDPPFRRFVIARTLLLVSALSPPFVIALAVERTGADLAGLGPFVISAGIASLIGGRLWGGAADRSSRLVMVWASGLAAALVAVFLVLQRGALGDGAWLYVAVYLALALVHTGARVGRSVYVVDLGTGDRRTAYVAASNTAMGERDDD